jgi:hypothetical protein
MPVAPLSAIAVGLGAAKLALRWKEWKGDVDENRDLTRQQVLN